MHDRKRIQLHHAGVVESVLGPGRRLVLWVRGCSLECPGCIEKDLWERRSEDAIEVESLAQQIGLLIPSLDGITFSGGEPMDQASALLALIRLIPACDRMMFTGYSIDAFTDRIQSSLLAAMDLVVDGRFEIAHHGDHLWRGSSNQRLSSPSGKYSMAQLAAWMEAPGAGLQLHVDGSEIVHYGIPIPGTERQLRSSLVKRSVVVSDLR